MTSTPDGVTSPQAPPAAAPGATELRERPGERPVLRLEDALDQLGRLVVGQVPLVEVLTRTAQLAAACVPGAEEVSVTLLERGKARSAAFSGRLAVALDERQYEDGSGPCLDAARGEQVVRIDDTGAEAAGDRYPGFAAAAAREGVRSVLSVGMAMPQALQGSLNVYRFDEGVLDEEAVRVLQTFAAFASVVLANHGLYASAVALGENLQAAQVSRAVIEQAKGVLVVRLGCTPEEAFEHLARQSQRSNRKLRELATEIVERAGRG